MRYKTIESLTNAFDAFHPSIRPTDIHLGSSNGRYRDDGYIEIHWPAHVTPAIARTCESNLECVAGIKWNQTFIDSDRMMESEELVNNHIVSRYELITWVEDTQEGKSTPD